MRETGPWLKELFSRSLPPVVLTGIKSAGKSVLWDFLSGEAYDESYEPPDASADIEEGKLKGKGKGGRRVRGIVIPGEQGLARQDTFEKHFASKGSEVSGLVYVACAGLAKPRSPDAHAHLARKFPALDNFVEAKLAEELDDFDKVCHELESYWRKHRRPLWLLVVTAKADLYQDRLPSISDYYCLGGGGAFAQRLERVQDNIGRLNLAVDSAAVACLLRTSHGPEPPSPRNSTPPRDGRTSLGCAPGSTSSVVREGIMSRLAQNDGVAEAGPVRLTQNFEVGAVPVFVVESDEGPVPRTVGLSPGIAR